MCDHSSILDESIPPPPPPLQTPIPAFLGPQSKSKHPQSKSEHPGFYGAIDSGPTSSSIPISCGGFYPEFFPEGVSPPSPIPLLSPFHPTSSHQPTTATFKRKRKVTFASLKDEKRRKLVQEQQKGTKLEGNCNI